MKVRFTDEQIIKLLKEHEAGEGAADICRRYRYICSTMSIYGELCIGIQKSQIWGYRQKGTYPHKNNLINLINKQPLRTNSSNQRKRTTALSQCIKKHQNKLARQSGGFSNYCCDGTFPSRSIFIC